MSAVSRSAPALPTTRFGNIAVLCFVVVQYLDGALTYMGVHTWGTAIEANPLVSSAVSVAGVGGGLAIAKLTAIALGVALHLRHRLLGVHPQPVRPARQRLHRDRNRAPPRPPLLRSGRH